MPRTAEIARQTKETDIKVRIDLDGKGINNIDTGIGFFDHMLTALSKHSGIAPQYSFSRTLYITLFQNIAISTEKSGIIS